MYLLVHAHFLYLACFIIQLVVTTFSHDNFFLTNFESLQSKYGAWSIALIGFSAIYPFIAVNYDILQTVVNKPLLKLIFE